MGNYLIIYDEIEDEVLFIDDGRLYLKISNGFKKWGN